VAHITVVLDSTDIDRIIWPAGNSQTVIGCPSAAMKDSWVVWQQEALTLCLPCELDLPLTKAGKTSAAANVDTTSSR
jgi:hypothetical protein